MPIADMSAAHIAGQQGFFEPQRQNNALLEIFGLEHGELITLSLESFPMPKTALEPVELDYLNEKRKVAGKVNEEDMQVVVKDFVDVQTLYVLESWFLTTYDPYTGLIGLAKNYKKKGAITMYGPNGKFDRVYNLVGLWINNFDRGDIDMTSGDKKPINITLSVDKILPDKGVYSGAGVSTDDKATLSPTPPKAPVFA